MQVASNDEQQIIAIHDSPSVIHHQHTIAISVERNTKISMLSQDSRLQLLHMGGAAVFVDIQTIRLSRQHRHIGAQLLEYTRSHFVGRTMGAIDNKLQPGKIGTGRHAALAKLDVAARRIVDARDLAQLAGLNHRHRCIQQLFDHQLDCIRQLGALPREKLDAIVIMRVVRGTDHDTGFSVEGTRQVSDRRCRHWPQQHYVSTCGGQAGLQRGLKHVTGNTGVLAHQNAASAHAAERHACRPTQLEHEIRSNRKFADPTTDTVGAKIFFSHKCSIVLIRLILPRQAYALRRQSRRRHAHARYARPW